MKQTLTAFCRRTGSRSRLVGISRPFGTVAIANGPRRLQHEPMDPAKIEWGSLGFDYLPTKHIVTYEWEHGRWNAPQLQPPIFELHAMSNPFHYGQAVFEGLKAFATADGGVHVFNAAENAKRLQKSCRRIGMPEVQLEMFQDALDIVITHNKEYVPPYGSNGSLYIRPFVFGHGPKMGLGQANQYTFAVLVNPVGSYYKTPGLNEGVDAVILDGFDRAAPHGIGNIKAAGNYAADVLPSQHAKSRGYPVVLYLDAKRGQFVEEFSTSNFIGISRDGIYVTPASDSILESITNKMLQTIAADIGMKVEKRPVRFSEVRRFVEVGACGTAVVITPIKSVTDERASVQRTVKFNEKCEVLSRLYQILRDVQVGQAVDKWGWRRFVCKRS